MKNDMISILLVEDDDVDVMNVQRAFQKININNPLFVASNGEEALALLRDQSNFISAPRPQVILLDINLPRMNGIEFLTELRADPLLQSSIVFILTTSDDDRDKMAAYDLNVAGYILKPVEWSKFIEAMANLDMYWSLIEIPQEHTHGSNLKTAVG